MKKEKRLPRAARKGLLFWNLICNEIVETLRCDGNEPIALENDLIVVIRANSRKELEKKVNDVRKTIEEWWKAETGTLNQKVGDAITERVPRHKKTAKN